MLCNPLQKPQHFLNNGNHWVTGPQRSYRALDPTVVQHFLRRFRKWQRELPRADFCMKNKAFVKKRIDFFEKSIFQNLFASIRIFRRQQGSGGAAPGSQRGPRWRSPPGWGGSGGAQPPARPHPKQHQVDKKPLRNPAQTLAAGRFLETLAAKGFAS